jgi:hypothetical protein
LPRRYPRPRPQGLKPNLGGHRTRAMKHIHEAAVEVEKAIKYVDSQ